MALLDIELIIAMSSIILLVIWLICRCCMYFSFYCDGCCYDLLRGNSIFVFLFVSCIFFFMILAVNVERDEEVIELYEMSAEIPFVNNNNNNHPATNGLLWEETTM